MRELWGKGFAFWKKYEHHIGVGALLAGFGFDVIIADRPDSLPNNILLLSYLLIAGAFIIILNLRETRIKEAQQSAEPLFLLLVLQFCFGGLASNLLILYGRSGTLAGSALFVLLLLALIVGNEFLRSRYALLRFNVSVYYVLLLSYFVIAVPTFVTHSMGTGSFLLSGVVASVFIALFLTVLFFAVFRGRDTAKLMEVSSLIVAIFLVFNLLYFLNVIPPVPLSLKDIGIYHSVLKHSSGGYVAIYEAPPWWQFWRNTSGTYTLGAGGSAFCYSSVFAPAELTAPIYHTWEVRSTSGEWEVRSKVSFPISGGRDEGYRGFSVKSSLTPGTWRCNVETARGALIGRTTFTVVSASTTPALVTKTL